MWRHLREALPRATIVDTDHMEAIRRYASEEELEWYRRGAGFCDAAFEALAAEARLGMKEHELVAIMNTLHDSEGRRTPS